MRDCQSDDAIFLFNIENTMGITFGFKFGIPFILPLNDQALGRNTFKDLARIGDLSISKA